MANRFMGVKTLEQLYCAFMEKEGVENYNTLSDDELEVVAIVFEAKLPNGAIMPKTPLTEDGYTYIWNCTVEEIETAPINIEDEMEEEIMREETIINVTVNNAIENMEENTMANETINNATVNNNNMEEETMRNENINETAATTEEVTMGEKAKNFAENAKEKLVDGFEFVVENIDAVAGEVKNMANMNNAQLEQHLTNKGKEILDKIVKAISDFANKSKEDGKKFSFFADVANKNADKANNIVELIKATLDEEDLSGWGKFKAIVKELIKWLLKLLLKVGAIVLKLALTVVVGAIKIGAVALVTTGKAVSILHKEIVKPSIDAGKKAKKAWDDKKAKEEFYDEDDFEEEDFQEVREALDLD